MKTLIVSRTKMSGSGRCIGGIAQDGTSLRLLNPNGQNWDTSAPFQIGDIWDLNYTAKTGLTPPHVEDVVCASGTKAASASDVRDTILELAPAWTGGISQLFDGVLGFTAKGNGFVSHSRGVPSQSTGFWISDKELRLRADAKHYDYPQGFLSQAKGMSYVGESDAIQTIPSGTLIRVSLARWWKPDDVDGLEERCYLQLSGWY